VVSYDGMEVEI